MKVLVLYENPREMRAAENLASVLNRIGAVLANSTTSPNGMLLHVTPGPLWDVEATVAAFDTIPKPRIIPPRTRKIVRELIFDDDDEKD
jgi:hypothetical protein